MESSGKSTLGLHAIAEVQKQGGVAALIDAENAFDKVYAAVSHVLLTRRSASVLPDTPCLCVSLQMMMATTMLD